ncbi:hypothetical protein [Streptomyces sp. NPDC048445]|uniref:hypothetical protein n=1 Tax=unclassified Streptomyces TaxID=2593676 RepID=UPI0037201AA9|nr:hypothetical protein OG282_24315 [Streptomyces sp. NBC_01014]
MMTNPNMVFSTDPRHGLVARSGWEQEEARTVLRDLGWEWAEELHAFVPPDDVPEVDAGLQAVEELHLHGHRTGYAVGPYGTMRLTLDRAEQVFTRVVTQESGEVVADSDAKNEQPGRADTTRPTYGVVTASEGPVEAVEPESPAI